MPNYRMQGQELHNSTYQRIAELRGNDVFDANYQKVGEIRGNEIFNAHYDKVAEVRGDEILDSSYQRIGGLSDARASIEDAAGGVSVAALWYFFVR